MRMKLMLGDCLEKMKKIPNNYVDTCITDPPYGYNFMGKDWDAEVPNPEYWEEVLRCLKPGAFLLCFAGTRSWHWMAISIEKAGFEIRDTIMWLHGQGFPKSYNIAKGIEGKLTKGSANWNEWKKLEGERKEGNLGYTKTQHEQGYRPDDYTGRGAKFDLQATTNEAELWKGYGTALKPAWEPIIVAMKPRDGSFVNNALEHGVSGLNIDGGRIPLENEEGYTINTFDDGAKPWGDAKGEKFTGREETKGRWPANVILDDITGEMLNGKAKFFFCAKASKKEKNLGLENLPDSLGGGMAGTLDKSLKTGSGNERNNVMKNNHPTVKPQSLMEYLCTLTRTPTGGIVLDPFMGSGTTGIACVKTGRDFIGIEMDEQYFEIAEKRIEASK